VLALIILVAFHAGRLRIAGQSYLTNAHTDASTETLNVDLLAKILDELWPPQNKNASGEDYAGVLVDLAEFAIKTNVELRNLIQDTKDIILEEEKQRFRVEKSVGQHYASVESERLQCGLYFTHVGLTRQALARKFGERWRDYSRRRLLFK
jgi:putative GTP pyrophosphokinase